MDDKNKKQARSITTRSIKYNSIMNLILAVSQSLFPMIMYMYAARVLNSVEIGRVSFAISFVSYFAMFAALGIPTYGIRACAEVRDSRHTLSKTVGELFLINTVTTFFSMVCLLLAVWFIPSLAANRQLICIAALNIIGIGISGQWFYQGIEQYGYITRRTLLIRILSLAFVLVFVKSEVDTVFYCFGCVMVEFGSCVINLICLHKYVELVPFKELQIVRHLKSIFYFFASSAAISIYTNLDIVMLGFLSTNSETGLYSLANKIYRVVNSIVAASFAVFLPRIANCLSNNSTEDSNRLVLKGFKVVETLTIPLVGYFVFFSSNIIRVLFGRGYEKSGILLAVICICNLFVGVSGIIINLIMIPNKHEKYSSMAVVLGAIVNFLLNLVLIPLWNSIGATIATVVTEFIVMAVVIMFEKHTVRRLISGFKPQYTLGYFVFTCIITLLLKNIVGENCSYRFILLSGVWFVCMCAYLVVTKNEIAMSVLRRRKE